MCVEGRKTKAWAGEGMSGQHYENMSMQYRDFFTDLYIDYNYGYMYVLHGNVFLMRLMRTYRQCLYICSHFSWCVGNCFAVRLGVRVSAPITPTPPTQTVIFFWAYKDDSCVV